MKFAHMGDCHLGGWAQAELRDLNYQHFKYAVDKCIREKVELVLITGDFFDSAYPSIDTLKDAFAEFRKLKEASIPVFLIAGSHDYSVSGKTFLDVLDKAGFCKNVALYDQKGTSIILIPTLYKNYAIYGFPGKKSSMEIDEIERIKLQDSPGLFKILMLHTAIRDAVPNPMVKAVDHTKLPAVNYLALSHLHINYIKENRAYSGPIFPNNISELEELRGGSFCIYDNGKVNRIEIRAKDVCVVNIEIKNAVLATQEILAQLEKENIKDKILILKLFGIIEQGRVSDIDFQQIEAFAKKQQVYSFLKTTTKLHISESEISMDFLDSANLESQIIKRFEENNPGKYNQYIPSLIKALQIERIDDEKISIFEDRLISETRKILEI